MSLSRSKAAAVAAGTLDALRVGSYLAPDGTRVDLAGSLAAAVAGTVSYPPAAPLPAVPAGGRATRFEVTNETTLDAVRRLAADGTAHPGALNFASAKHPGGGFLNGARAQEESLCRASGLYPCVNGNPMYAAHGPTTGGFYTNSAVYSPGVPVFKFEDGSPMPAVVSCGFVTAPAVNAGVYLRDHPAAADRVRDEMRERVDKVLAILAGHGHRAVVLGAWGCGVFRNDPAVIAELFREAFAGRFRGAFDRVVFAVLDGSAGEGTIAPFRERFGGG